MAETAKKKTRALVIGTKHEYQRYQDTSAEREEVRAAFEKRLRKIIAEEDVSLIAEEAGDDAAVLEGLRGAEEATPPELAKLFEGTEVVDGPVSTIAKQIVDERPDELRHEDIAPNARGMSIGQRDEAMAAKVKEVLGDADSVLVIVGEDHRAGVARRLSEKGVTVKSIRFPE